MSGNGKTVATRSVRFNGTSFKATVPKEIADRYELDDGETLLWEDDGDGTIQVRPASRDV